MKRSLGSGVGFNFLIGLGFVFLTGRNTITAMDEANTIKEKAKVLEDDLRAERQYITVFFSWYYKGFELFRRYLVKHRSGVDMENLDLEVVDQEMVVDEASQFIAVVPVGDTSRDAPLPRFAGDDAAAL